MKLDKPSESVEFLEYMLKQHEKVQTLQKRLSRFSKCLFIFGVAMTGYATSLYFERKEMAKKQL